MRENLALEKSRRKYKTWINEKVQALLECKKE